MNKILNLLLAALLMLAVVGCANTESIPSNDFYTTISEKKMPYYCKREIAKEFGIYSGDIYLYPVEYEKGAKIIYGKYRVDQYNLEEFACIFNGDDTYAGIKMRYTNVKNELCYKE